MTEEERRRAIRAAIDIDVVVIGGGQSALATGFYLRRSGLSYVLLDEQEHPGGAWQRAWRSLRLFSPAQWSSLPGWLMPHTDYAYPSRVDAIAYLAEYERRYELPVERPVRVNGVERIAGSERLLVHSTRDGVNAWRARAVVSATGTWANSMIPDIDGAAEFNGQQIHSAFYVSPDAYHGKSVIVVGAGNSGAQIVAELSGVCDVKWANVQPPVFLPDHVDGRYLFEQATARYKAIQDGRTPDPPQSLGHIVSVETVRDARDRGLLASRDMFTRLTRDGVEWPDGTSSPADVIIWATGFRPALDHLAPLGVLNGNGRIDVTGTRSTLEPMLWLVGYGDWTGFASATLIGAGRAARATVDEITAALE
jgi:putative flavoprotein involved in K+ transport